MIQPGFLCVGLTPTVQRTLRFSQLTLGEVNRAWEVVTTASGKAVNVARVLDTLGADVALVHPLGGDSGRSVERSLGVSQEIIWAPESCPTRTCTTLLTDSGVTTELVEEARPLDVKHVEALLEKLEALLPTVNALALSGSLPPSVAPDFYARVIELANASGVTVFIDAQKEPLRLALAQKPYLAKPNRPETIAALGLAPESDALTCATALISAGAQNALVSDGRAGSLLLTAHGAWRILPPTIEVLNPIGSGDSLLAGLVFRGWYKAEALPDAACFGTACAAANCLTLTSGEVRRADVERLFPQVTLERVQ